MDGFDTRVVESAVVVVSTVEQRKTQLQSVLILHRWIESSCYAPRSYCLSEAYRAIAFFMFAVVLA